MKIKHVIHMSGRCQVDAYSILQLRRERGEMTSETKSQECEGAWWVDFVKFQDARLVGIDISLDRMYGGLYSWTL